MKLVLALSCGLLLGGSAVAQMGSPGGVPSTPPTIPDGKGDPGAKQPDPSGTAPDVKRLPKTAADKGKEVHISGCLRHDGSAYSINDRSSNKTYALQGSSKDFTGYINHEVAVQGREARADTVDASGASPDVDPMHGTLQVTAIKKLADACHDQPR